MQSTPLVHLMTTALASQDAEVLRCPSLLAALATVPDPRRRQGQRYLLPFLLGVLVLALLYNGNTLEAAGQWCAEHRSLLTPWFPAPRFHTPTGSLYRRLLPRLSVTHPEAALALWVRGSLVADADEALALDGKTVRGAHAGGHAALHLLSVCTHQSGETLAQVRVERKTNEAPVTRALLPVLPLAGRVVTADALHTSVATARAICAHDADYLLVVKGNQPLLYTECAAYFADPQVRARRATTIHRQRGRTEVRTLLATAHLTPHVRRHSRLPHMAQAACLHTMVQDAQKKHHEMHFLLANLPAQEATPERLLALVRGHGTIESRYWVRDVTFGEDASPLRSGDAPQILVASRHLTHTMIHRSVTRAIAAARRSFSYHLQRALPLFFALPRIHRPCVPAQVTAAHLGVRAPQCQPVRN